MSSKAAMSMPWRFITTRSNLTFWPILSTEGSSSSGFSSGERLAHRDLVLEQPAAEQVAGAGRVGERHIGGAARRRRQREADEVGLHRIERGGLGVEGDDACLARLGDPVGQRLAGRGCRHRRWRRSSRPSAASARSAARTRPVSAAAPLAWRRRRAVRGAAIGARWPPLGLAPARRARAPAPTSGPCASSAALDLDGGRLDRRPRRCRSPRRRGASAWRIPWSSGSRSASARSVGCSTKSSSPSVTGTSFFSVTSSREMRALSALAMIVSRRLSCLISPARASSVSRSPNCFEQLRCRLRPDAGNARHVVDRVAGHRLQVDHLFRRHAPFLDRPRECRSAGPSSGRTCDTSGPTSCIRSLSEEMIVVSAARLAGQPRIGGDEVVGLEAFHLDAGQVEGAGRLADQPELRDRGPPAAPSGWPCIRDRARCGRSSTNSRRSPRNASASRRHRCCGHPASASTPCCRSRARR